MHSEFDKNYQFCRYDDKKNLFHFVLFMLDLPLVTRRPHIDVA